MGSDGVVTWAAAEDPYLDTARSAAAMWCNGTVS